MAEVNETNVEVTAEVSEPEIDYRAEYEKSQKEISTIKKRLGEVNSECAGYKKQIREKMSADEQAELERAEKQKEMEAELETLRKDKVVSDYTARLMGCQFDKETAHSVAMALASGDMETVFSGIGNITEIIGKSAVAKAMDAQKGLTSGNPVTVDLEKAEQNNLRRAMGLPTI